ncbi:hypothetical protein IWQ62_003409 [Dispira parvispora]|uniref:Arrestin C-terminal-like domain-containing protein n=1 Tax=Dispira parvispora TaxID=1520584 RepID=A0A9W8AU81_9FUNG|nr:hypothetical protein IWQ62_003409 [Dispira parvispora]
MQDIKIFDVTFPTHPGVPKCKPGSILYGAVAIHCLQPLQVESLGLRFVGKEEVATCVDTKLSEHGTVVPQLGQTYFDIYETIISPHTSTSDKSIPQGYHLFHFKCKMPPINFPVPTESQHLSCFPCPAYEIRYFMQADLNLADGTQLLTESAPVHPDPLSWPESLLPQALGDPTLIREAAYQGNKLAYHIKTQLDRSAYFPGDTISVQFDIKPVVNHAPPGTVELSIRERCECHSKYLSERRSSEEPVWARTRMLHREALQFTKGSGAWYRTKAQLTVPDTVCPVDGVHMAWSYALQLDLFESQEDNIRQAVGIIPLPLASGLHSANSELENYTAVEDKTLVESSRTFPRHELQPISIGKLLCEPHTSSRLPVLRVLVDSRHGPPLSPGLTKGNPKSRLPHSVAAPQPNPATIHAETVVNHPRPAIPRKHQTAQPLRDQSVFTIVRPKPFTHTVIGAPSDRQQQTRMERSARYKTCVIGLSRSAREQRRRENGLLDVDVGESFSDLFPEGGFPVVSSNSLDKTHATTRSPDIDEQLAMEQYLKDLTWLRPKNHSLYEKENTACVSDKKGLNQDSDGLRRQRSLRHRTCVMGPGKKLTRSPLRQGDPHTPKNDTKVMATSKPRMEFQSQGNTHTVVDPTSQVARPVAQDTVTAKPRSNQMQRFHSQLDPEQALNLQAMERELEEILLNPNTDHSSLLTPTSAPQDQSCKKPFKKWEPCDPVLGKMNISQLQYAMFAPTTPQQVSVYKMTTAPSVAVHEGLSEGQMPLKAPVDTLDFKPTKKSVKSLREWSFVTSTDDQNVPSAISPEDTCNWEQVPLQPAPVGVTPSHLLTPCLKTADGFTPRSTAPATTVTFSSVVGIIPASTVVVEFDDDNESLYTSDDSDYEYELRSPIVAKHLSWKKLSVSGSTVSRAQRTRLSQLVDQESRNSTSTISDPDSALDTILDFYRETSEVANPTDNLIIPDEVAMYENELTYGDVRRISERLSVLDEYLNADEAFLTETHAVALNEAVDEFLKTSSLRAFAKVRRLTKELP